MIKYNTLLCTNISVLNTAAFEKKKREKIKKVSKQISVHWEQGFLSTNHKESYNRYFSSRSEHHCNNLIHYVQTAPQKLRDTFLYLINYFKRSKNTIQFWLTITMLGLFTKKRKSCWAWTIYLFCGNFIQVPFR